MRLTSAYFRRFRSYKTARHITGVDKASKNVSQKPRSRPHEPNFHFTRGGGMHGDSGMFNPRWDIESANYQKRYGEPLKKGRPMFDGDYTPSDNKTPFYYRKYDKRSPAMHEPLKTITQFDNVPNRSMRDGTRDRMKWWKDNWWKLDLIDPEKWALFPGDVVKVVDQTHADYGKFGRIKNIYMPHGLIWIDGLNLGEPTRIDPQVQSSFVKHPDNVDYREYPSMPFNYRDVKYLKYGQTALNLFNEEAEKVANWKESELGEILEFLLTNPRRLMTFIEYENAQIKEINGKSYDNRSHAEYHYDLLEASGILQTVNVRMKYTRPFQYAEFDLLDFNQLGASRECRDTGIFYDLPQRLSIHENVMGCDHESAAHDVQASQMDKILEEASADKIKNLQNGATFEDTIRAHYDIPLDDKDVFYYRKLH